MSCRAESPTAGGDAVQGQGVLQMPFHEQDGLGDMPVAACHANCGGHMLLLCGLANPVVDVVLRHQGRGFAAMGLHDEGQHEVQAGRSPAQLNRLRSIS